MTNWLRWKNSSQQSSFKSDIKRNTPYLLPTIKKQWQYWKSQYDEISRCFIRWKLTMERTIKYLENKITKDIGLRHGKKPFADEESLFVLMDSYIHSYLNYANLALGSTYWTNLKKIRSQQKPAIWIFHNLVVLTKIVVGIKRMLIQPNGFLGVLSLLFY